MSEKDDELKRKFDQFKGLSGDIVHIMGRILETSESIYTRDYLTSGYGASRLSLALKAVETMERAELIKRVNDTFALNAEKQFLSKLESALKGYMWSQEGDESERFNLVMTTPKEPSILKQKLAALGANKSLIRWTHEAFEDLARKAESELVVMTPFLDRSGADLLIRLIKAAKPEVRKTVILRFLDTKNKEIFEEIRDELLGYYVNIVDYSLERPGTNMLETFHAKVILADNNYCYLGSSNLDRFSIENSMELGALIRGNSVKLLKKLMDIIISISKLKT
ncbi:hypothetical protein NBRC116493_22150 [Aurantivibrio infirmus]